MFGIAVGGGVWYLVRLFCWFVYWFMVLILVAGWVWGVCGWVLVCLVLVVGWFTVCVTCCN